MCFYCSQELDKRYESELEVMNKRQRKEIEKLEIQHIQQFKSKSKQLKSDQVSDPPSPVDHMIPPVDHMIPLVDHMIPAVDHMIPAVDHMIPAVDHMIIFSSDEASKEIQREDEGGKQTNSESGNLATLQLLAGAR